jgi:hypothetical protein
MVNYSDLGVTVKHDVKTVTFNGSEIKVRQHISEDERYDLVMITLQKAEERGIYNPVKLNTYLYLNIVYMYSDIIFSEDDRADEVGLRTRLLQSGLEDAVLAAIPMDEVSFLVQMIDETAAKKEKQNLSIMSTIERTISSVTNNIGTILEQIKATSPDTYEKLTELLADVGLDGVLPASD